MACKKGSRRGGGGHDYYIYYFSSSRGGAHDYYYFLGGVLPGLTTRSKDATNGTKDIATNGARSPIQGRSPSTHLTGFRSPVSDLFKAHGAIAHASPPERQAILGGDGAHPSSSIWWGRRQRVSALGPTAA